MMSVPQPEQSSYMHTNGAKAVVALDTSCLAQMSHDTHSAHCRDRQKVRHFVLKLAEKGYATLITLHHIEELMQHDNAQERENRLEFLASLPDLAWIPSAREPSLAGSILDLAVRELKCFIEQENPTAQEIVDHVSHGLFCFSTGQDFVDDNLPLFEVCCLTGNSGMGYKGFVASMQHARFSGMDGFTLGDLRKCRPCTPDESRQKADELCNRLSEELKSKGDKRLAHHNTLASQFLHDALAGGIDLRGDINPADAVLESLGLCADEFDDSITAEDLGEELVFRKQVTQLAEIAELSSAERLQSVRRTSLPSWRVPREIAKVRCRAAARASGSDMYDGYLVAFALYCDLVIVDKRTAEYTRRVRRKLPELDKLCGKVAKAANYSEVLELPPFR